MVRAFGPGTLDWLASTGAVHPDVVRMLRKKEKERVPPKKKKPDEEVEPVETDKKASKKKTSKKRATKKKAEPKVAAKPKADTRTAAEILGAVSLQKMEAPPAFSCLVYGPPGIGKTQFCGTAPDLLHIDADKQGKVTLYGQDIESITPTGVSGLREVLDLYHAGKIPYESGDKMVGKSVAVDPVTEVHSWMKREVQDREGHEIAYLDDWNVIQEKMMRLCTEFRDLTALGINVIFTATEQHMKDEVDGGVLIQPDMFGKIAVALPRIVDCVLFMHMTDSGQRVVLTKPTRKSYGKVRTPKGVNFPGVIVPDFNAVLDIFAGGDPAQWVPEKDKEGS